MECLESRLPISGMFAKLQKATVSFVMSVCLHGTTRLPLDGFFTKFDIWIFFEKSVKKIKVSLQSDNNNGTVHEEQYTV